MGSRDETGLTTEYNSAMVDAPVPFRVDVPDEQLESMLRRVRETRWAPDIGNEAWTYGVERGWLQDMARYWSEDFDWRAQEAAINSYPQFRVEIDGVPIHFIHVRGKGPNPRPIILSHGWPWTFWDWRDVIDPLVDPAAHGGDPVDSFDVVVPSLPGFGFSTPLTTTGIGARTISDLWVRLMSILGYDKFCAAGGDWGAVVTGELGHGHPEHLTGVWLSLPTIPGENLGRLQPVDFADDEKWMIDQIARARPHIQSHLTVQRYEPQTIAYALADSPVGTAAWIWSRRRDWSDNDGDVLEVFDRDFLCTTASIYWLTGSIASSLRIYYEHARVSPPPARDDHRRVIDVPTGFGVFPRDVLLMPRSRAAELTNLQRWSVLDRGGHFAPAEQPHAVADEIRSFFTSLAR